MIMATESLIIQFDTFMTIDHPFVFLLRKNKNNTIFIGRHQLPAKY